MSLEPNTIDILRLENLKSGFESCRELTISASLEPGQHLAIYGPSGCGKSSLLKVIAGLMPAKTGTMEWQGKSVSQAELGWWRNQINYLPQDPVMGGETLLDVLLLPWQLKACTAPAPSEQACKEAISALGITHSLSEDPKSLSGGERQRLALARASLLPRPIWLMDEPTSALDKNSRDQLTDFLAQREIIRISVSHDPVWYDAAEFKFDMGAENE
ncbi:ABC transporter ATP-binding protein [Enterovibrio paralichthyis]|uniref:ABC transporter ATP-binding protein n=1 Tax=Enterovibrio paralichthyis TaxID=2853805 RepID=UPI001C492D09|nr:ATP-binding cassette domain-containing protein [Enterovibrio paralichthyis]MBV7298028.1 ATP-binding cassette domain-containing protein [Enterovibrio paralichthyis]